MTCRTRHRSLVFLAMILGGALLLALGPRPVPAAEPGLKERERSLFDIGVFARVGYPGQPEGIAIGPRGRRVYVGTNNQDRSLNDDSFNVSRTAAPSKIFSYSRAGEPRRTYTIKGQKLDEGHGLNALAVDADGRVFALDRGATSRVIVINPKTGRQRTYARFRDVPPCDQVERLTNCSLSEEDRTAEPDYAAFGPDGSLYVSDIEQALIWRVPPGGGKAKVWLTHEYFDTVFGPNGLQVLDGGRTLRLAVSVTPPSLGLPSLAGAIFDIPIRGLKRYRGGRPGRPSPYWLGSRVLDTPDGFAVGRSGRTYAALSSPAANQIVVISRDGRELRRVPNTPEENSALEIPLQGPASAVFMGRRLLITNQSVVPVFPESPESWAVLDMYVGERGLPLFRPRVRIRR